MKPVKDMSATITAQKISAILFIVLIIGLFNDSRLAQRAIGVFLYEGLALYAFWASLFLFLLSFFTFLIFKLGKPSVLFILTLIWLGNYLVVLNLGYDMPIQLIVTLPVAFFSTTYFVTKYFELTINQLCSS